MTAGAHIASPVAERVTAIRGGSRAALAQALNLLDDNRDTTREQAVALLGELEREAPDKGGHLIGVTGPPGVGKSTLGAALISEWRRRDHTVGVLAVDPSSPLSGGALLGDRLRMHATADDDGVFIRSLSSRGQYGGLSAQVWPMSLVMRTVFDIVLIETVGVGQREIDVSRLCDTTCFVAQPGSGDSVQSLKAGILEVPHILVVNKSDMGDIAARTVTEIAAALTAEHPDGQWQVPVLSTSATEGTGVAGLADLMAQHYQSLQAQHRLSARRRAYQAFWIYSRLQEEFGSRGVGQLGGEEAILSLLESQTPDLYAQHNALRERLLAGSGVSPD